LQQGKNVYVSQIFQTQSEAQSFIEWAQRTIPPPKMLSEREADQSPLPSADIKSSWSYNSTQTYAVSARCFDYHEDRFALRQDA
jgi:hypothetical protein